MIDMHGFIVAAGPPEVESGAGGRQRDL